MGSNTFFENKEFRVNELDWAVYFKKMRTASNLDCMGKRKKVEMTYEKFVWLQIAGGIGI